MNNRLLVEQDGLQFAERVDSPEEVLFLLESLALERATGWWTSAVGQRHLFWVVSLERSLSVLDPTDHSDRSPLLPQLIVEACEGREPRWPAAPCDLTLIGYNSRYHFRTLALGPQADLPRAVVACPTSLQVFRRRRWRRKLTPGELTLSFRHPCRSDHIVEEACNLSYAGLSFTSELDPSLLVPGAALNDLRLLQPGRSPILLEGNVRWVRQDQRPGSRVVCGLQVKPRSPHLSSWQELVESLFYPTTTRRSSAWISQHWKLFQNSGYLALSGKTPAHFPEMQQQFTTASHRIEHGGQDMGCNILYLSGDPNRPIEGAATFLRIYSTTWIGLQLVRQYGAPSNGVSKLRIFRDIYLHAFEHCQRDSGLRWLVAYLRGAVEWHRWIHLEFTRRHLRSSLTESVPLRLMEGSTLGLTRSPAPPGWDISPARSGELEATLAVIGRTRSTRYLEALDLVPERFSLVHLNERQASGGLIRERCLLLARLHGRPVAAAVLESGTPGYSLFNLLDGVRLFSLLPEASADEDYLRRAIYLPLLEAAGEWYRERGRETFIYFDEAQLYTRLDPAVWKDHEDGFLWILSADLLPEFLEYVWTRTAHPDRKRPATHRQPVAMPVAAMPAAAMPVAAMPVAAMPVAAMPVAE